jgi:hypothetical protein
MNKAEIYLDEEARDTNLRRDKVLKFADSLSDSEQKAAVLRYAELLREQYIRLVEITKQVGDKAKNAAA